MTTRTTMRAPNPTARRDGMLWDMLGYATKEQASNALDHILAGENDLHGNARAYWLNDGEQGSEDLYWIRSHYHNDRHPLGTAD